MALLYLLVAYAAVGSLVALAFVIVGVTQVQPMPVTVGARILLLPGAFVLWPLVVARWRKSLKAKPADASMKKKVDEAAKAAAAAAGR